MDELHVQWQLADVVGVGHHILGEGAVDRVPGVLLRLAQRFPAGPAIGAMTAGGVQPRHANPVPSLTRVTPGQQPPRSLRLHGPE